MTPSTDANGGKPRTLPEPYYDCDGIRIFHARCEDVLPHVDPASVGLLLTDPPYGIDLDTDYSKFRDKRIADVGPDYGRRVTGDAAAFDPVPLLHFRRVFLFGANHYHHRLPEGGSWFVWDKVTRNDVTVRQADGELAWHNAGGKNCVIRRHMWVGAFRDSERNTALHPTQKPVSLMRWIVERWTEPGDLVLDPYMGSGPIAQACYELGRRYIGCEIVEDYCATAVKRLSQQVLPLEPA